MSKTLVFIAATGFVLCILFFTLSFLIAGSQIFDDQKPLAAIRPLIDLATRKEWRWDGGDTLAINAPVVLHYEKEGPPHVVVSGPADLLQHVRVGGGQIGSDSPHPAMAVKAAALLAVVGGVPLRKFVINGRQQLQLGHIDQDKLDIRINDGGSVSAEGRVRQLNLVICGPGHADLGRLDAQTIKLTMLGDGEAVVSPHQLLYLTIVGNAVVRLAARPASIQKTILGSGRIVEEGPGAPPLPPPPPQPFPVSPPTDVLDGSGRSFVVMGHHNRQLGHFDRGSMNVTITGSGSASADGKVDKLAVMVSGSGDARFAGLSARQVSVTIAGSGDATIAPQDEVRVTIMGSGNVYLASKPRKIERNIMGSGRVIEQH